jgi:hypothetical protein
MKMPEGPQKLSTKTIAEFDAKHVELGEKEFPATLEKILLNKKYTISELEFEFGLPWQDLKPLLDASSTHKYIMEKDEVVIILKTKQELEEELKEHRRAQDKISEREKEIWIQLKKILGKTFYKTGEYRSILVDAWPPEHQELLKACLELGIIQKWWHDRILVLAGHRPSWSNKM